MEKHFVRVIDENGLFVRDDFVDSLTDDEGNPIPTYIETPCPAGFYLPKWDGTQWVEGKTADEIAAIKAGAKSEPTLEERVASTEAAITALMGV